MDIFSEIEGSAEWLSQLVAEHCPSKRIHYRKENEDRLRELLNSKKCILDESEWRDFFRWLNRDFWKNAERYDRFGQTVTGNNVNNLVKNVEVLNEKVAAIWNCTEGELNTVLDNLWKAPLSGSGKVFPSLILYLRNPEKYNIWLPIVSDHLIKYEGVHLAVKNSSENYNAFNTAVINFRDKYELKPQMLDIVLTVECNHLTVNDEDKTVYGDLPRNLILYGPPGTGKTYNTIKNAVEICDGSTPVYRQELVERYRELTEKGRVQFITFHQSFGYEDFVEGIRPVLTENGDEKTKVESVEYQLSEGVFKKICDLSRKASTIKRSGYDFDPDKINIWKLSLGNTLNPEHAIIYESCISENYIWLGYGDELDYSTCNSRDDVLQLLRKDYPDTAYKDYGVTSVNTFKNKMKIGDLVIVSDGNHKFRAIGKITGDYKPPQGNEDGQRRDVEWLVVYKESQPKERILTGAFSQMTLYKFSRKTLKLEALTELLATDGNTKSSEEEPPNHVLIIDEINRGNISEIFGELITLIEEDKRLGREEAIEVTLPYSKEKFGVPSNLFIIGTMNTADRSIEALDTALRRRFSFVEILPDPDLIKTEGSLKKTKGFIEGINTPQLLSTINKRIEILLDQDHTIGHSYFLSIETLDDLKKVFHNKIIPLLQEYFFGDIGKIGLVIGKGFVEVVEEKKGNSFFAEFDYDESDILLEKKVYHLANVEKMGDETFKAAIDSLLNKKDQVS